MWTDDTQVETYLPRAKWTPARGQVIALAVSVLLVLVGIIWLAWAIHNNPMLPDDRNETGTMRQFVTTLQPAPSESPGM